MNKDVSRNFHIFFIIMGLTILQVFGVVNISLSMGSNKEPTAIVIDADTGEPIEGAVAIAIWRKHSIKAAAWFEGGMMVAVRIEEAVSDREGRIYIDDFFDWHLFENRYPDLTIYKPGYVCWDHKSIYINEFKSVERKDFNKESRVARMMKRPKEFSFNGHWGFVDSVTGGDSYEAPERLFRKAFNHETPYQINERKKRREMQKKKGRQK